MQQTISRSASVTLGLLVLALTVSRALVQATGGSTSGTSSYVFTTIDLPNSNGIFGFTGITGISNDGRLVGDFSNSSGDAFLLEDGERVSIHCAPKAVDTNLYGINKRGDIAGVCTTPTPSGNVHGFLRHKHGKILLLDVPGSDSTEALGINDFDQVVGEFRDSRDKQFHGFIWGKGRFLRVDVPFRGATLTGVNGVNNVGELVGVYFDDNRTPPFFNGHSHGFVYKHGTFESVDFPGAEWTTLQAINDSGLVAGTYGVSGETGVRNFLLDGDSFTSFEIPFPNVTGVEIFGLNNRGQIVGFYVEAAPTDFYRGFVATPQGGEHKSHHSSEEDERFEP
jgi:hypothetical protein